MVDISLPQFVAAAKNKGLSESEIKKQLSSLGWSKNDIDSAFNIDTDIIPPLPHSATGSLWDTFVHILMFISLLVSTISFLVMSLLLVDYKFSTYESSFLSTVLDIVNVPLAALIVSAPAFCLLFSYTTIKTQRNPSLNSLRARKVLIYLTLVITFITLLISLITLVANVLQGEVSSRFWTKFLIVTLTTGGIFSYYLSEVRHNP